MFCDCLFSSVMAGAEVGNCDNKRLRNCTCLFVRMIVCDRGWAWHGSVQLNFRTSILNAYLLPFFKRPIKCHSCERCTTCANAHHTEARQKKRLFRIAYLTNGRGISLESHAEWLTNVIEKVYILKSPPIPTYTPTFCSPWILAKAAVATSLITLGRLRCSSSQQWGLAVQQSTCQV